MLVNYFLILTWVSVISCGTDDNNVTEDCNLPKELIDEIASYAPTVNSIINNAVKGSFKGFTYNELETFVDTFGSRMAGTENLENAINYMLNRSISFQLDNVHGEEVQIPKWVRGSESAYLIEPRNKSLSILGLGYSVRTPPEGITAEVLVVKSFDDLNTKSSLAKGKIVVFNEDYQGYGTSVAYRGRGATAAAKVGAVASLIRSVTPFSLNSPHTGMQSYGSNVKKIPTACITVEDAHLLERLQNRGETIKIQLKMDAKQFPDVTSRNTVVELKGTKKPEKVVIVSGHLDSWDVGQGAMDDGGGAFISWSSLVLLKKLGLKPKRTIRAILWTAEEMGLVGAFEYQKAHVNDSDNFVFIMESDEGTFAPLGIKYSAGTNGGCILKEVMKLLQPINATQAKKASGVGSDIAIWTSNGFSGASLLNQNEKYFWYHHSEADTLDVEDPGSLDKNTALWASVAFVIADLSIDFPRELTEELPRTNVK